MNYVNMVRNAPNKSEKVMWESVDAVDELLAQLKSVHPELARAFLMKEHKRMYGPYFDEELARETVAGMYHNNSSGERVAGEVVSPEDSMVLLEGVDAPEEKRWDAYVGANGFMHDLARTRMSREEILSAAREFWMDDDDFDGSKVFWYYSNK